MAMAHARKLTIMRTALVAILFAIVVWVVVQLAVSTNAAAAREEAEQQCSPISKTFEAMNECVTDVLEGVR